MHCCGPNLFWDGCKKIQILGPRIVEYYSLKVAGPGYFLPFHFFTFYFHHFVHIILLTLSFTHFWCSSLRPFLLLLPHTLSPSLSLWECMVKPLPWITISKRCFLRPLGIIDVVSLLRFITSSMLIWIPTII